MRSALTKGQKNQKNSKINLGNLFTYAENHYTKPMGAPKKKNPPIEKANNGFQGKKKVKTGFFPKAPQSKAFFPIRINKIIN